MIQQGTQASSKKKPTLDSIECNAHHTLDRLQGMRDKLEKIRSHLTRVGGSVGILDAKSPDVPRPVRSHLEDIENILDRMIFEINTINSIASDISVTLFGDDGSGDSAA